MRPDNCVHLFCRRCFEVYSQKFSKCPICKKNFNKYIDIFKPEKISNLEKLKIDNYYMEDKLYRLGLQDKIREDFCIICHKNENKDMLICCDRCLINQVHYYCDPTFGLIYGKYICPICRSRYFNHIKK